MRNWLAALGLIRIPNCLLAAVAVGVGWYMIPVAGREPMNQFAMLATFFVCGFGNIINDIRDVDIDRVAHPRRGLPSGSVSIERARTLAFVFLVMSFLTLVWLNGLERVIVVGSLILVVYYNIWLKHTPYWGNLAVSILGALTFIMGGASTGLETIVTLPGPLIPAVFALLMHFPREIIKDFQDRAADQTVGSGTAPLKSGRTSALIVAYIFLGALCLFALSVYFIGWFTIVYLLIVLLLICVPTAIEILWLGFDPDALKCRIVSAIIKLQMVIGVVALLIGKGY